jgi:hypothetical protein
MGPPYPNPTHPLPSQRLVDTQSLLRVALVSCKGQEGVRWISPPPRPPSGNQALEDGDVPEPTTLVSLGFHSKISVSAGWLKQQTFAFTQFWSLEVQDQGAS